MAISLAFARIDLSSILPRQNLRNSLLYIAVVLDSRFMEREEKPTLSMRLLLSSEDDSFAVTIEEQSCALSNASEPVVTVKIGGISKEVLVDSGSASNLISQDELKKPLQSQGLKIELQLCSKKLYAYGDQKLEVVGQFKSELAVEETKVLTHLVVVKRGWCLVGYLTATELGILHVGPVPNPIAESCNTVGCPFVESLKAKSPGVFRGVGRLKNYQLKLHIDPQVIPVVQKMRRIPFTLKDKVTAKVNELLERSLKEWKGLRHG